MEAIELSKKHSNTNSEWLARISLAELFRKLERFKEAESMLKEGLVLGLKGEISQENLANLYNRYAAILHQYGTEDPKRYEKVVSYSKEAIRISQILNLLSIQASSYNELGLYYFNEQDFEKADSYYKQALKIERDRNNPRNVAQVLMNLARLYRYDDRRPEALECSSEAMDLISTTNWVELKKDVYYMHSMCLYDLKRYKESRDFLDRGQGFLVAIKDIESKKKLVEIEVKYKVEEKESQIVLEKQNVELARNETIRKTSQRDYIVFFSIILILLLLLLLFAYYKIKQINTLLERNIQQKEVLLQEVNHRVKNNMQMVSNLLELQMSHVSDENSKNALNEGATRIRALGFAHQKLYQNEKIQTIDTKEYFELIVSYIIRNAGCDTDLNFMCDYNIHIEKAQAIGFILNELITNSIKYAWDTSDTNKKISASTVIENDQVVFMYADNGKGFPNGFNIKKASSLGSTLICSFVDRQLEGTIETENNNGAHTLIKFNKNIGN
jgi:two-component sensor histidine kinase